MSAEAAPESDLLSALDEGLPSTEADDHDDDLFDHKTPSTTSFLSAFIILVNSAMGSGTLQIPACYPAGMGFGLFMSALFALLAFLSMHFLIESAKSVHKYDYQGLFEISFGSKYNWILTAIIVFEQLGSLTIYCLFIGRLVSVLIGPAPMIFHTTQFWTFGITALVVFPLTFLRQISRLRGASAFAVLFVGILVVHAIFWCWKDLGERKVGSLQLFDFARFDTIIAAFSVNSVAFTCHLNLFPCLEQLKDCTVRRARYLGASSLAVVFLMYSTLGLFTYFDKRDLLLQGKALLEYYNPKHWFTILATSGVVVILIVCCPIQLWALRNSLNDFLFKGTAMTPMRWIGIGGGCSLIAAFLSSTSENITIFFDIVGGIASPSLLLLLPAAFYMKCHPDAGYIMKYLAIQHIVFMVLGAIASIYQVINSLVHA
jgi:amino acid permease